MDTISLFDNLEMDITQQRIASRRALALAHTRVEHNLGRFLRGARTEAEFEERLALLQEDFAGFVTTASAEVGHTHPEHIAAALKDHYRLAVGPGSPIDPWGSADMKGFNQEYGQAPEPGVCALCANKDSSFCPQCMAIQHEMKQQAPYDPMHAMAAKAVEFEETPAEEQEKEDEKTARTWKHAMPLQTPGAPPMPPAQQAAQMMGQPQPGQPGQPPVAPPGAQQALQGTGQPPVPPPGTNQAPQGTPRVLGGKQGSPLAAAQNPADQDDDSSRLVTCPECGGDGKTAGATSCGKCKGKGKVPNFGDSMLDALTSKTADEKHDNTELDGPEPTMNKSQGPGSMPDVPGAIVEKDVTEPIKATNEGELKEIGDIEHKSLPSNTENAGFQTGGEDFGPHTDTFGKGKQADPVTNVALSHWPSDQVVTAAFIKSAA
jgi:hypothetical protein